MQTITIAEKIIITNKSGKNQYSDAEEVWDHNDPKAQGGRTADRIAVQHNVSGATVKRDAKVANTIDAIGEASLCLPLYLC